ncbi:MAG: single-stranded-DNA-specific exonuclease RecJ [Fimbriimonadaceae bacterium]|nr:single-stranded-DNA-specific exonuclease RecJ [Fimbriimonadaceae bacterium]
MGQAEAVPARWEFLPRDASAEAVLCRELGIPTIVAATLVTRGVTEPEAAHRFLHPCLDQLHSPWLLPDIREAVSVLAWARENKAPIFVHGDYDVDGVTSTSLFTRFLRKIGCEVRPHVPHRVTEGYGIHMDSIKAAHAAGAQVMLTCDCGSGAYEPIRAARELGMKVVVTDHHQVDHSLPDAHAVVNPQREGHNYPWKELAGVGVALKVGAALAEEIGAPVDKYYRAYMDFAALGTIADLMPLTDENRVIASIGLARMLDPQKAGLRALKEVARLGIKEAVTARHVGFVLGPRINAAGRIDDPTVALKLLTSECTEECTMLAAHLDEVNERRKDEQRDAVQQAIEAAVSDGQGERPIIFVASADWHQGIVGLVAGRLLEQFRRPAFAASIHNGIARGSARSLPGFDVGLALRGMADILDSGGGHELAAGFTVQTERLEELRASLERRASESLTEEDYAPRLRLTAMLDAEEASPAYGEALLALEPFGQGNPKPIFGVRGLKLMGAKPTSKPEHAWARFQAGRQTIQGIAFGKAAGLAAIPSGSDVEAAIELDVDEFRGARNYKWIVRDVRTIS